MTLIDVFRTEIERSYAIERRIVPTLERMELNAREFNTRAVFQRKLESIPSRLARLEMIFALHDWEPREADPLWFAGWQMEIESWMYEEASDDVSDSVILTYLLKVNRMRTACFESLYILAMNLGSADVGRLIGALWYEDREEDEAIAASLMASIERSAAVSD